MNRQRLKNKFWECINILCLIINMEIDFFPVSPIHDNGMLQLSIET